MINLIKAKSGRLRNGWWILAFYLILAVLLVPITIVTSRIDASPSIPLQACIVVIATLTCLAMRREHPRLVFGTLASWRRGVPLGLIGGSIIWLSVAVLLWATNSVDWEPGNSSTKALLDGLTDSIAVAVVEEVLFRGFVFQRMIAGIGTTAAQITIACYFVLIHSGGLAETDELRALATVNVFFASLLFGAAFLSTRSLALPISLHFALNFVQGPLLGFGVSGHQAESILRATEVSPYEWWTGGAYGLEASAPGTIAIIASFLLVCWWRAIRRDLADDFSTSSP